ncbi:MAG: PfaD family polyunsaturated fatty acid/polyketide biosynthesis protein [Desulfobacteraceae bacterium]|nr:MAG: PfaD family polyunsaturated fatty acid/polyketide biosynthesis protein [Desulfobacteraceae bacterium]
MLSLKNNNLGWWSDSGKPPEKTTKAIRDAILDVTRPGDLVNMNGDTAAGIGGHAYIGSDSPFVSDSYPLSAFAPPLHPEKLGNPLFRKKYNIRYAYIAGAMANGITSVKMVTEAGNAGFMGFFGAAGLHPDDVDSAIFSLKENLGEKTFGFNLIHSPNDPELESAIVNLYLKRKISLISASAYIDLTLPLIYYRIKGIHRDHKGEIACPNRIIAKVSRSEIAGKFFSPPPAKIISQLLERKLISDEEARLAGQIPVAEDLTAEADSGGHTDNRPAISLLPAIIALKDQISEKFGYKQPPCVGLGGGISTPYSTAAAFAMGAAFVLTGSVNQSCVEAGTSETVRKMLAEAGQADVTMAPAADMFEMGVKVQVLKRGTMFPFRAAKLYDLYSRYDSFDAIPLADRLIVERDILKCGFNDEWEQTKKFFEEKDPSQIKKGEDNSKHKMALVFRSYLGKSSNWAKEGESSRKIDYQIWCGPSLGAFNQWVKGTFLEKPENRKTVAIAMNLMFGAAVITRASWITNQGVALPQEAGKPAPLELNQILKYLG